jgi:hypothetical protein
MHEGTKYGSSRATRNDRRRYIRASNVSMKELHRTRCSNSYNLHACPSKPVPWAFRVFLQPPSFSPRVAPTLSFVRSLMRSKYQTYQTSGEV